MSAYFCEVKDGSDPSSLMIENPIDLSDWIGMFVAKDFEQLQAKLVSLVSDKKYNLYFHHKSQFNYHFNPSQFQHGAIYTGKKKLDEKEPKDKKVTASQLGLIQTACWFEKHVKEVADVVYRKKTRKQKNARIHHYNVQLCIIIVKQKVPKQKSAPSNIVISSLLSTDSTTPSIEEDNAGTSSIPNIKKRKSRDVFKFKARSICIALHVSIQLFQKRFRNNRISSW